MTSSLWLFSTTDAKGGRDSELDRLIRSLHSAPRLADIKLTLLIQRMDGGLSDDRFPSWITLMTHPSQISLSRARNTMLSGVLREDILSDPSAIVGFPDDDCFYAPGALSTILGAFDKEAMLDFWFCRYASVPTANAPPATTPSLQQVIGRASSNTIFLRAPLVAKIGYFDESLGVGTPLAGGEDTDYAMRAFLGAHKSAYCAAPLVGHRDMQPQFRSRYYGGALRAIVKNATWRPASLTAIARKLAVGVYLVLAREMSVGLLVSRVLDAWRGRST